MAEPIPLRVVHDIDGPKVRLGVLWFAATVAAALLAPPVLALLLAGAAALAADQVLRLHDRAGDGGAAAAVEDPLRLPALLAGAALPLGALGGSDTLLAAAAAAVVVVLTHRVWSGPPGGAIGDAALVLGGALPLGLGAAAPVLLAELGGSAAIALLVLVAAYDAGDFLIGTGTSTAWEGPIAGVLAVLVCGFGIWAWAPPPLEGHGMLALVATTAVLAPFGPLVGSVLIGDGRRPARFVRRLDTLLVVGPVAAYAAVTTVG